MPRKSIIKRGRPKKSVDPTTSYEQENIEELEIVENPKLEELKTARDTLVRYGINTDSTLENTIKELEK